MIAGMPGLISDNPIDRRKVGGELRKGLYDRTATIDEMD